MSEIVGDTCGDSEAEVVEIKCGGCEVKIGEGTTCGKHKRTEGGSGAPAGVGAKRIQRRWTCFSLMCGGQTKNGVDKACCRTCGASKSHVKASVQSLVFFLHVFSFGCVFFFAYGVSL